MAISSWTNAQDQQILDGLRADLTYTQIADQLGVSKSMVSGRLYRLRAKADSAAPPAQAPAIDQSPNSRLPKAQIAKAQIPKAGTLPPEIIATKNSRKAQVHTPSNRLKAKREHGNDQDKKTPQQDEEISPLPKGVIAVQKPTNAPKAFIDLAAHECSWCVEDGDEAGGAQMMCCAAPVMDKTRRPGDRRASHCTYHYALSVLPEKALKKKVKKRKSIRTLDINKWK